ncbi:MAG: hypothetical protein KatS3mg008_0362 [Acidimicrobiales bacterium]|nr:MAG: hypothetical protein KatS3mg008_0362 [Acidimicrobiales bacterium]
MTIWTPDGEHRVVGDAHSPGQGGTGATTAGGVPPSAAEAAGVSDLGDEERERAEALVKEMAEIQRRLVEAPAEDVVANHAIGLFELAALHLKQERPDLPAARLAIDAMAAIVEALADRLGRHKTTLEQALAQIRLTYVRVSDAKTGVPNQNEGQGDS